MKDESPKITEYRPILSRKSLDRYTNTIVLVPAKPKHTAGIPYWDVIQARMKRAHFKLGGGKPFITDLPNENGTHVTVAAVDSTKSTFELLSLGRELAASQRSSMPTTVAVACYELEPPTAERMCQAAVAALLAACFSMPDYKKETPASGRSRLREIYVHGHKSAKGYTRTLAEAKGNNLARYLTAQPANQLTPGLYRRQVEKIARRYGWSTQFFDLTKLRRLGAGAFLAVAQASAKPDAGILHLRYTPKKRSRKKMLALIGKGICFDTGGTNLKTSRHMYGMHEDMEGSAVALGTLLALTELKVDFPIECWMALAENNIGPNAYRQNEVVRAADGTTIEVVHTDAEGRMVLADTLHLASKKKPGLIVDYATLTGACVAALSTRYSGAMTNRMELIPKIIEAGWSSGERVWPFPLDQDYEQALKSDVADIKQCSLDNDADHILGAVFLRRFLAGDPDWIHVDLSSGNHKGGLAHIPTDITGFGVRFTLNLLFDQDVALTE
jgi:leucyl aminopeptidase